jgi:hypothetical protein
MSLKRGRATGWIVAIVAAVFLLLALSCGGAVLWRFYLGPDDGINSASSAMPALRI